MNGSFHVDPTRPLKNKIPMPLAKLGASHLQLVCNKYQTQNEGGNALESQQRTKRKKKKKVKYNLKVFKFRKAGKVHRGSKGAPSPPLSAGPGSPACHQARGLFYTGHCWNKPSAPRKIEHLALERSQQGNRSPAALGGRSRH